ncbi:protein STICHEL-like 2 isoform X2 [Rosa rugosa]|uniref:protein STICHEL-like 2 isoform X2 n=1 Tax=Rosa rugosa TaxID=74645 RepID=UPI002B41292D|nr:protein STICHEL-like 2 isoform X2 [Rosa rugosa]
MATEAMKVLRKQAKNTEKRCSSSSSIVGGHSNDPHQAHLLCANQFCQCESLSLSSKLTYNPAPSSSIAPTQQHSEHLQQSFLASSSTNHQTSRMKVKSQHKEGIVSWQSSKMRRATRRIKVISLFKRLNDGTKRSNFLRGNCQDKSREENDHTSQDKVFHFGINSVELNSRAQWSLYTDNCYLNQNLSNKYRPQHLKDIAGHEMVIKAITNAIQQNKIAPLYLFYGARGSGKTSIARILALALNCGSSSFIKPCWKCQGCSRSLSIMELCSGSTVAGFKRIRKLLQSISSLQATPGFKVFILEECESFSTEAWDELSGIANGAYNAGVVFILITTNADMVPRTISSRCQKFFFPKLRDSDIMLKLTRIAAQEGIRIEKEAIRLVTTKAQGSLREAENILDQLILLGPKITSSMAQQLVGLVPHDKLTELLTMALSGDTMQTLRCARQLIGTGIEPQMFVSQLVSHITNMLFSEADAVPETSSSTHLSTDKELLQGGSEHKNNQSVALCCALQILAAVEKQPRSSTDQTLQIFNALLQIASRDASSKRSSGPVLSPVADYKSNAEMELHSLTHSRYLVNHIAISNTAEQQEMDNTKQKSTIKSITKQTNCRDKAVDGETHFTCTSEMEEIWLNMLGRMHSSYLKDFLRHKVKLASLTITSANAILHLMFKRPEDKQIAQMSEEHLSETLESAIGCPIILNMSLEPVDLKISDENSASSYQTQLVESSHFNHGTKFVPEPVYEVDLGAAMQHSGQMKTFSLNREQVKANKADGCKLISKRQDKYSTSIKEETIAQPQETTPFNDLLRQKNQEDASIDSITDCLSSLMDTTRTMRTQRPQKKWLSVSSAQRSDASIEPYSQDISFDNAKTKIKRRAKSQKLPKAFFKVKELHDSQDGPRNRGLHCSWSCKDICCQQKQKIT